ncbi:MAG: 16S rRNA (guanine(527)-N(7))-methyltransferase RsmG [Treponemataceae bacterium]|nr:16S rRNA (guanine(527)-N(7))-methyltransferase RsmG [Treponemataceae bacterium]
MNFLEEGLAKLNFSKNQIERIAPLMENYAGEILLFNGAYNLVNASSRDEIFVRHILDSLSAAQEICRVAEKIFAESAQSQSANAKNESQKITIADIGSGGGLPGIPLAAAFPQFNFVLVERMSKRCAFLENVRALLGLENVRIENSELEKIPHESFEIATFRAFRPLEKKILSNLLAVLKKGGALAAYKAKRKNIVEEMRLANCSSYNVIALDVPFLTDESAEECERNLVLIEK